MADQDISSLSSLSSESVESSSDKYAQTAGVFVQEEEEPFSYFCSPTTYARIAFGSAKSREVLPLKPGTSKFTSYYARELFSTAPTTYDTAEALASPKIWSLKGCSGLATTSKRSFIRCDFTPGPKYDTRSFPGKLKKNRYPFNFSGKRSRDFSNNVPGPGSHVITSPRDRRIPFAHSFGGKKILIPGTFIKCVPVNIDVCCICNAGVVGDYWHYRHMRYICRPCMAKLTPQKAKEYRIPKLEFFEKIRDCSSIHGHDGAIAAIFLVDRKMVKQQMLKEAYLKNYFSK